MYKILIVEDDPGIAAGIAKQIEMWELECKAVSNFRHVFEEYKAYEPHLVLMDISLPFFDGYHWCSEIRRDSSVPIVFISSASDNMNIVMAMNMGGDDFIAKPFDLNVLMAKIRALLRRTYDFSPAAPVLEHRGASLDTGSGSLTFEGKEIELSKNEFKILLVLLENKGKIVRRDTLMERLWKTDSFVDENTLTVNINRLRNKLEQSGLTGFIETKFGQGYVIK